MRFAEKLAHLLELRDVKAAELVRRTGIPQPRFSEWLNPPPGKNRMPTLPQALLLARALGVPLEYLADAKAAEVPAPALTPDEEHLLKVARSLRGGAGEAVGRIVNYREPAPAPGPGPATFLG